MSTNRRGAAHPRYGNRIATKPITRVSLDCPECETPFEVKRSHMARRRFCSKRCYGAFFGRRIRGERNPNWTGGYEPYYGSSWHPAIRRIRQRDRICQDCGVSPQDLGRDLDVHHIVFFREFGPERHEEANQETNLVGLCFRCHLTRHRFARQQKNRP